MKEKKLIIGLTAIIAIVVLIAIVFKMNGDKAEQQQVGSSVAPSVVTTAAGANEDGTNFWDNVEIFEGDGDSVTINAGEQVTDEGNDVVTDEAGETVTKAEASENGDAEDGTDSGDGGINIKVEEGNNSIPTDASGETISEEYPGQADGWSPLVSPDDLD